MPINRSIANAQQLCRILYYPNWAKGVDWPIRSLKLEGDPLLKTRLARADAVETRGYQRRSALISAPVSYPPHKSDLKCQLGEALALRVTASP